jgi:glutamate-1-semialdehyde 2,1-aminomutase
MRSEPAQHDLTLAEAFSLDNAIAHQTGRASVEASLLGQPYPKSTAIQARLEAVIPGGAHTYAKGSDQFPEFFTSVMERGQGCNVWDADGNKFIEYGMGLRSVTLGHACPGVLAAIYKQLPLGVNFGRPSTIELTVAERLLELIPGAEMVKFGKNGSDATSGAVWLARAYTGRNKIAICASQPFFSVQEWFIGSTAIFGGIPQAIRDLTVGFEYNNIASLEALFAAHPGQIACVVLEAEREYPPAPGYLQAVRDLCTAKGALLIFDEIVAGFRYHIAGGQGLHGIVPDLAAFGKALGNGFSISALVGKREFMRLGDLTQQSHDRVFLLSTTYGAETHHLAAALAVMDIYTKNDVCAHLARQGTRLRTAVTKSIAEFQLEAQVPLMGRPECFFYGSRDENGHPSQEWRTLFLQETLRRGLIMPSMIVSYAHTDADIDETAEKVHEALYVYRRALDEGLGKYLHSRPIKSVYRTRN